MWELRGQVYEKAQAQQVCFEMIGLQKIEFVTYILGRFLQQKEDSGLFVSLLLLLQGFQWFQSCTV